MPLAPRLDYESGHPRSQYARSFTSSHETPRSGLGQCKDAAWLPTDVLPFCISDRAALSAQ